MKVSPLETHNKYNVLVSEETKDSSFCPIDSLIVTYYALNFISKLWHRVKARTKFSESSKDSTPWKVPKTLIQSANLKQEVSVKVALQMVDTHVRMEVDALLSYQFIY